MGAEETQKKNAWRCGDCAKFHSISCPMESVDSLRTKTFFVDEDTEADEECFTPKEESGGAEEEKINLYRLAQMILAEVPIATDIRTYLMYRWNGKCWVDDAEGYIHGKLVEAEGEDYKPYHLTTLTQIIQGLTFKNGLEEPPPNLICFENGVLDINTMEFKPHSPDLFFRNTIHANYDPNAKPEEFLKWLDEVQPDKEAQKTIQEMFGYCFHRDHPFHVLFFLVGAGRNGKGTLMRTLTSLLGKENCTNIPLERLPERFQVTNLIGKLVNIVSEPKTSLVTTETIKMLTGQDLITAEFKGKQKTVQFVSYTKIVVIANRLPPVNDSSLAWWERVVITEFPITIPPEKQIPNIEEKWLNNPKERSGIVNWALEGLKRLLANRGFTRSQTMLNVIEQYKRWSQPVQYFLDKYCQYGADLWITKKALYEAYKTVCEDEGLPIVSEEVFSREVRKKPRVILAQKRITGKMERIWVGIALKSEAGEASEASFYYLVKSSSEEEKIEEEKNLYSIGEPASPASATSNEPSTKVQKPNFVRLEHPEMFSSEKCFECGGKPVAFQVNFTDDSWGLLCEKCRETFEEETETQPAQAAAATLTQENVKRVYEAVANLSRIHGSAHESEIVHDTRLPLEVVKEIFKFLEKEGKIFSPSEGWWKLT
jgi:putative DNA primase/helicase